MIPMMTERASKIDADLVVSAQGGNSAAREALGRSVGQAVYVFAIQLTRNRDTALDVAQDAVLRFFKDLDRFDSTRPLEPWLYQITRNRVRDLGRRDRIRQQESLDAWIEQGRPGQVAAASPGPATEAERNESQRQIWRAVSQMSDQHREIFVLRDFHGLSYREIADVLSIPQGTVMSRLHTARKGLQSLLLETNTDNPANQEGNEQ